MQDGIGCGEDTVGDGRLGRGVAILKRMVRKEYPKMLSFKPIPERSKRASYVDFSRKSIPGRRNSKSKGPEAGTRLVYLKRRKEAGVAE